jgi:hypothetical protein
MGQKVATGHLAAVMGGMAGDGCPIQAACGLFRASMIGKLSWLART